MVHGDPANSAQHSESVLLALQLIQQLRQELQARQATNGAPHQQNGGCVKVHGQGTQPWACNLPTYCIDSKRSVVMPAHLRQVEAAIQLVGKVTAPAVSSDNNCIQSDCNSTDAVRSWGGLAAQTSASRSVALGQAPCSPANGGNDTISNPSVKRGTDLTLPDEDDAALGSDDCSVVGEFYSRNIPAEQRSDGHAVVATLDRAHAEGIPSAGKWIAGSGCPSAGNLLGHSARGGCRHMLADAGVAQLRHTHIDSGNLAIAAEASAQTMAKHDSSSERDHDSGPQGTGSPSWDQQQQWSQCTSAEGSCTQDQAQTRLADTSVAAAAGHLSDAEVYLARSGTTPWSAEPLTAMMATMQPATCTTVKPTVFSRVALVAKLLRSIARIDAGIGQHKKSMAATSSLLFKIQDNVHHSAIMADYLDVLRDQLQQLHRLIAYKQRLQAQLEGLQTACVVTMAQSLCPEACLSNSMQQDTLRPYNTGNCQPTIASCQSPNTPPDVECCSMDADLVPDRGQRGCEGYKSQEAREPSKHAAVELQAAGRLHVPVDLVNAPGLNQTPLSAGPAGIKPPASVAVNVSSIPTKHTCCKTCIPEGQIGVASSEAFGGRGTKIEPDRTPTGYTTGMPISGSVRLNCFNVGVQGLNTAVHANNRQRQGVGYVKVQATADRPAANQASTCRVCPVDGAKRFSSLGSGTQNGVSGTIPSSLKQQTTAAILAATASRPVSVPTGLAGSLKTGFTRNISKHTAPPTKAAALDNNALDCIGQRQVLGKAAGKTPLQQVGGCTLAATNKSAKKSVMVAAQSLNKSACSPQHHHSVALMPAPAGASRIALLRQALDDFAKVETAEHDMLMLAAMKVYNMHIVPEANPQCRKNLQGIQRSLKIPQSVCTASGYKRHASVESSMDASCSSHESVGCLRSHYGKHLLRMLSMLP